MKRLVSLLLVCLLVLPLAALAEAAGEAAPGLGVVATDKGQVSGMFENGATYYKGIPFAKPPVGELRWAAPVEADPWEGVKACDTYAPMAMQILSTTDWWGPEFYYLWFNAKPPMSEDCLYLNVVTPATQADANLPVLVWIHGGANMHGYSWEPEFEPSKLAAKGVIVVSVEYRMGVFGWMATKALSEASETGTSGNYGLLDLIQSLKWVQKNIAAFGGDPGRVTIAGQSAGAGNSTALMTSPLAKGLFHQAIMDSSFGALGTRVTLEKTQENCEAYLKEKGYENLTVEELRGLPTSAFMSENTPKTEVYGKGFSPCTDGYVLTETPKEFFLKEGALEGKNLLFGSNSGEGNAEFVVTPQADIMEAARKTYGDLFDKYNFAELYKGTNDVGATMESLRLRGDQGATQNMIIGQALSGLNPGSNLFPYYFTHRTPGREEDIRWAWHSSELWYTFNSMRDIPEQRDWEPIDYEIADKFSSYWANFIATGNPNGGTLPYWPAARKDAPAFMELGDTFAPRTNLYAGTKLAARDDLMREQIITVNGLQDFLK